MTKFFVQLLLSAAVGLGAAVGFTPDGKDRVREAWSEAKAAVRETARFAMHTLSGADAQADVSVSVHAEGGEGTSAEADVQAAVEGGAALNLDSLFDETAGLDGSLSAESQTDVGAETEGLGLNLTNALNSIVGFSLGFGK